MAPDGDASGAPSTDDASLERLKRFGGDKLLGQMIVLYLEAVPERLSATRVGLDMSDVNAVELALHSLKSSSAQLGALRMQQLCERGEIIARGGSLETIDGLLAELEEEYPRVKSWLERVRNAQAT